jgi:hypothetical protein
MAKPDEGRIAAIQARTFALLLVALDGQAKDVEPLLDDLSPEELGDVVHGLASLACVSMLPRGESQEPEKRAVLGRHLRALVLEKQSRAQG